MILHKGSLNAGWELLLRNDFGNCGESLRNGSFAGCLLLAGSILAAGYQGCQERSTEKDLILRTIPVCSKQACIIFQACSDHAFGVRDNRFEAGRSHGCSWFCYGTLHARS